MQFTLSSTALPEASIETLRHAAQWRDLAALELVLGVGHPQRLADPGDVFLTDAGGGPTPAKGDPPVQWLLLQGTPSVTAVLYRSRQASLLDAGLLLQNAIPESPLGLPLGLVHGTDRKAAQKAAAWARMHDAKTCWTVELGHRDPEQFADVLEVTAPTLAHVRLLGAGPETQSAAPGTAGTGAVLKELALHGYSGSVALAPSADGSTAAWREWLFERRGWGCGTAAQKKAARDEIAS